MALVGTLAEPGQAFAVIKETTVEKIRTQASGLQCEFAKAQHVFLKGKADKFLLIVLHSVMSVSSWIMCVYVMLE